MILKKKKTSKRSKIFEYAILFLGATFIALAFNFFLLPNNVVVGFSGLSVVANNLWGIKPSIFLAISYTIILILSFIFLGKEKTKNSIIGSILYPILVELTSYLTPYIDLNVVEAIVLVIAGALLSGLGSGLVYKINYSTGGSDVVNQLLSKLLKRPMGTCMLITNGVIISLGVITFGLQTFIYSLIVVYVQSVVIDKVMIGISQSKTFQIITESETEVKKFLLSKLSHGVTVVDARGGYTGNVVKMIMCIVPTKEYMTVKEKVLAIDPKALIMVSDVYEVVGNK